MYVYMNRNNVNIVIVVVVLYTCYPTFLAGLQSRNIIGGQAGDPHSLVQSGRAGELYQGNIVSVAPRVIVSWMHNNSLYPDILFSADIAPIVMSSHPENAEILPQAKLLARRCFQFYPFLPTNIALQVQSNGQKEGNIGWGWRRRVSDEGVRRLWAGIETKAMPKLSLLKQVMSDFPTAILFPFK